MGKVQNNEKKPSKQAVILRRHAEKCKKYMGPDEFYPLVSGLTNDQIAELSGVTVGTVRRWLAGATPIPYAVQQLFRLRTHGVVGKDWEGWRVGSDGLLYHPFWRRGFNGHELAGMWFEAQRVFSLTRDVRQLEKDCEALRVDAVKAEELAGYYKRQVRLEAQMGLALARIAG